MSERARGAQQGRRQRGRQPALPTEEKATDAGSKRSHDLGSGSVCVKQHLPCGWPSTGGRVDREERGQRGFLPCQKVRKCSGNSRAT